MKFPYISVKTKFVFSMGIALLWTAFAIFIALDWVYEIAKITNLLIAWIIVIGIAIIPGYMSAFTIASLLFDRRPPRKFDLLVFPSVSVLIAAYNEGENILSTLESIDRQDYPGKMIVYVINDGSTDDTAEKVKSVLSKYKWLRFIDLQKNAGKSNALNTALKFVQTHLTITIDGDSYLYKDAIRNLISRYLNDPEGTAAVAGAVLVRNSRKNLVTKVQEWDYFHGIAAVKRLQSLFQGTLVAQGAFSVYKTSVLKSVGGWANVVGEDIVLTWAILEKGYRVGYAEDALLFTNAPDNWKQFFNQRRRWSRGLIEAFKSHWKMLFKKRMISHFIWWNLLFPWVDFVYTFVFIPGMVAAMFGNYLIAGPLTLILLPMAILFNYLLFIIQSRMFKVKGLKVRKNIVGFFVYAFLYSIILQPACVVGYFHELFKGSKKTWGTK